MQERRHGPQGATKGKRIPVDVDLTFRTATGELVKSGKRLYVGESISEFEVFKRWCVGRCCLFGVHYDGWSYCHVCPQRLGCCEENRSMIQKEMIDSQYNGCTIAYKENNVYNIYMKPRGNKTDAMHCLSPRGVPGRVRTRKTGKSRSRRSGAGGAHDPMRDGAVDGDELMVPRVRSLPPEPRARQISEHELTQTCSVQKLVSPLRSVERSSARSRFARGRIWLLWSLQRKSVVDPECRNSSTECLTATVVDKEGASHCASSYFTAFITSLG